MQWVLIVDMVWSWTWFWVCSICKSGYQQQQKYVMYNYAYIFECVHVYDVDQGSNDQEKSLIEEQCNHWWANECPLFVVESLC